ncbi:MAG TPA: RagB/SusD family nutrient uptake outer membrane protein [Mucilaginibacter sp.]|jgi:hypothetical protein|nr:RagB/SusD family nutrient uptake outer membrane protein [Mucilaginibacter sp.]
MKQFKINRFWLFVIFLPILLFNSSCKKQDAFLNEKPNQALAIISTLSDCQLLLNNENVFNKFSDPMLGELATDDYYVTYSNWQGVSAIEQNSYIWAKQVYPVGADITDWDQPYQGVYYSNVVLDALPNINISPSQQTQYNQIKGAALFYRSIAFYNLVQTFALPYKAATAATDLGIPLRLSSNLNIKSVRATEQQCYNQIIQDLQTAATLLPKTSTVVTQPSLIATNALLARIYLAMGNYSQALYYSNAVLAVNSSLTDYNNPAVYNAFLQVSTEPYFVEDLYHCTLNSYLINEFNTGIVDSTLYSSYDANDLRKSLFFFPIGGQNRFVGSYEFNNFGVYFSGLATDEMYLIRAECYARANNVTAAMADLNSLLVKRYVTGTFVNRTAANADVALNQILIERRKELLYRGLRWTDLRRLNQDPKYAITLTRVLNGTTYTLPPNDPRYALPIPDNEIAIDGLPQNQR